MSYMVDVKREKIGKFEFVLIDDDELHWFEAWKDGKKIADEYIVVSTGEEAVAVYEKKKESYLKP